MGKVKLENVKKDNKKKEKRERQIGFSFRELLGEKVVRELYEITKK